MTNIVNASAVYVAVGGGGTPLEIYNKQNQWNPLSYFVGPNQNFADITTVKCSYQDNGDGTMSVIYKADGTWGDFSIALPSGYVINGTQTINIGTPDGSTSILGFGGKSQYLTFAVRKTS